MFPDERLGEELLLGEVLREGELDLEGPADRLGELFDLEGLTLREGDVLLLGLDDLVLEGLVLFDGDVLLGDVVERDGLVDLEGLVVLVLGCVDLEGDVLLLGLEDRVFV